MANQDHCHGCFKNAWSRRLSADLTCLSLACSREGDSWVSRHDSTYILGPADMDAVIWIGHGAKTKDRTMAEDGGAIFVSGIGTHDRFFLGEPLAPERVETGELTIARCMFDCHCCTCLKERVSHRDFAWAGEAEHQPHRSPRCSAEPENRSFWLGRALGGQKGNPSCACVEGEAKLAPSSEA